jgi:DEAD/DEAH box helicase domain-containing protein
MERVASIADIYINPNFDSELEAKFIESLRRLGNQAGMPQVKLIQEIVHGKSGYLLEVGDQRYWVEPQVDLGPKDGIQESSRPDFVLWPTQSASSRRPVAVFCDGWAYHQESARQDALKRSALVGSGKFWIWSVTWEDVKASLDGRDETTLSDGLEAMCFNQKSALPTQLRDALLDGIWSQHAVGILLQWLGKAPGDNGDREADKLARHAGSTAFRMVPNPEGVALEEARVTLSRFWEEIQSWAIDRPRPGAPCGNINDPCLRLRYWWPRSLLDSAGAPPISPGFLIYRSSEGQNEPERHLAWRRWLWIFNIFQMLPGFLLATQDGMDAEDYSSAAGSYKVRSGLNDMGAMLSAGWDAVIAQAMESLVPGLRTMAALGLDPPDEVGFELEQDGEVIAEAELAWLDRKVVLLMPEHIDRSNGWQSQGWNAIVAKDDWPENLASVVQVAGTKG